MLQACVENMALSHRLSHTTTARRACCRMAATRRLNTVVFLGSARDVVPPWGGEKRAGDRVLKWVQNTLASRTATYGSETISHDMTVLDPLEMSAPFPFVSRRCCCLLGLLSEAELPQLHIVLHVA